MSCFFMSTEINWEMGGTGREGQEPSSPGVPALPPCWAGQWKNTLKMRFCSFWSVSLLLHPVTDSHLPDQDSAVTSREMPIPLVIIA